jgi:pimeloyl-ACP methyl ester carboxylesterase
MNRLHPLNRTFTLLLLLGFWLVHPFAGVAQTLRPRVIVFVHGLHGNKDSWRNPNGAYWPDMVRSDPRFAYSDVVVAQYPSPPTNGKMSSMQLADILWSQLRQDHVWDHREVVFLAHSLGGILVEEMLLRHPADAARVRFIVSYGTPHEGSTIARVASIYDKDPLLNDLSDAADNRFLTSLESSWRGHDSVNGIHRFCAYESEDTVPEDGFVRYLKPHARVVSYFSATYGCDVTTPPQEIQADHLNMIRPASRASVAYDFFRRVYQDNPVLNEEVVTRDNIIGGFEAGCDQFNRNTDYPVPIALDPAFHEKVTGALAFLNDTVDVSYGFKGPARKLMVCLGAAHASLQVQFTIDRQVPMREPQP